MKNLMITTALLFFGALGQAQSSTTLVQLARSTYAQVLASSNLSYNFRLGESGNRLGLGRFMVMLFMYKASLLDLEPTEVMAELESSSKSILGSDPSAVMAELESNSADAKIWKIFYHNQDLLTAFTALRPENLTASNEETATTSDEETVEQPNEETAEQPNEETAEQPNEETAEQPNSQLALTDNADGSPTSEALALTNEEGGASTSQEDGSSTSEESGASTSEESGASTSEESGASTSEESGGASTSEELIISASLVADMWVKAGVLPRTWYSEFIHHDDKPLPEALQDSPEESYFYAITGLSDINAKFVELHLPIYLKALIAANENSKAADLLVTGVNDLAKEKSVRSKQDYNQKLDDVLLGVIFDNIQLFEEQ